MSPEFYFPSILSLHSQIGAVELYKVIIPSFKGKGKKNKFVEVQKNTTAQICFPARSGIFI